MSYHKEVNIMLFESKYLDFLYNKIVDTIFANPHVSVEWELDKYSKLIEQYASETGLSQNDFQCLKNLSTMFDGHIQKHQKLNLDWGIIKANVMPL